MRTGFDTAKGELLRSILFPRANAAAAAFAGDALRFIALMMALGLAFYAWDIVALARYGAAPGFILLRYLDLVTIAVPPALPACLTIATAIAVARLAREHAVHATDPAAVVAAGHLDLICFDKTGTLTEVRRRGGRGGARPEACALRREPPERPVELPRCLPALGTRPHARWATPVQVHRPCSPTRFAMPCCAAWAGVGGSRAGAAGPLLPAHVPPA